MGGSSPRSNRSVTPGASAPVNIVVVSDLHVGSHVGLCPPKVETENGSWEAGRAQRELWDCWKTVAREWHAPDILVCNGDAIEGQARKQSGTVCWTNDLNTQVRAAAACLELFHARRICLVNGSGYHVDAAGKSLETWLGALLGAEKVRGEYASDELVLRIHNRSLHFAHHIQVGTGWYRSTPLARELVFALLNETSKLNRGHKADIVVRSHVHYYVHVEFERQHGIITPCWQLQTGYMLKKSAFGCVPSIGAIRIRIWPGGEVAFEKRLFKPAGLRSPVLHWRP
jgi:hypothetical protein